MSPEPWRRLARAEARIAGRGTTLAGVDEAGRGPLAGPVVAAAVVLAPDRCWEGLDDSKKLAPETREEIFARVMQQARAFSWAVIGPRAIDRSNILRASLEAMRRAIARLRVTPDLVLVDGDRPAASVLAKVVRDRIMGRLDRVWPNYGFARHKGYATPEHLAALASHGPCPLHRYSFAPVVELELPLV